jgi:hypothetical protein
MTSPITSFFANVQEFDALARLVSDGFGEGTPRLAYLIKSGDKGRVAMAEWRGKPVIVKEIWVDDRPGAIRALEAEHDRLGGIFPYRGLNFAACLVTAPQQGLVILPFVPGKPLDEAMRLAPPGQRPDMMRSVVGWLVRSMAHQREIGSFRPDFWIARLNEHIACTALDPDDQNLLAGVVTGMQAMAPSLRNGPVPRGPVHGDFSSQNMFWDEATGDFHVFDIQNHWVAPVAIDLSWILGDLTYKALRDDPDLILDRGLAADLRAAAMGAPGLDHPDGPGGFMDFMTGHRHATVLLGKLDHPLGPSVRRAIIDWLSCFS